MTGTATRTKEVWKSASARYRLAHPERVKKSQQTHYQRHGLEKRLRNRYGITVEAYDQLLEEQDGHCALCPNTTYVPGRSERLAVDHDHKTKRARGLLCRACNVMLGNAQDLPERLEMAAQYLRKHNNGEFQ